mgnify:FL=1
MQQLANQLGITQQVTFHGQTDEVLLHLQQADLFVLPSRAEGISNALLEAMSCGLPVVVSAIPGNLDVIDYGYNGLHFPVGNTGALAHCLQRLLDQPDLREQLGRQARQTVEYRFSLNSVADQYIALYRNLLTSQP